MFFGIKNSFLKTCRSSKGRQYIAATAACVGSFGLGTGWSSPVMAQLLTNTTALEEGRLMGQEEISWIGAFGPGGAALAGPFAGFCIWKFGRRSAFFVFSAPFIIGWLLIAYAKSYVNLYIGRFITGFCGGASSLTCPIYIGETAERERRGRLVSGFQLFLTIGIVFSYILGVSLSWKYLALVCGFSPLIFVVIIIFIPESPRFLIQRGLLNEARAALTWLRITHSPQQIEDELAEFQRSVDKNIDGQRGFRGIFESKNRHPIQICLALNYFQQLSGINAVIFYTYDIFEKAGTGIDRNYQLVMVGIVQVLATLVSTLMVERVGRKMLLIISGIFMSIFIAGLGFAIRFNLAILWDFKLLPLILVLLYIISFAIGYGSIPWIYMCEILPAQFKEYSYSLIAVFNWSIVFFLTKFAPQVDQYIDFEFFCWFFAVNSLISILYVVFFVPETRGLSLEEIESLFADKK